MSRKKTPFQIGEYWLEKDDKSPNWYYAWYSKRHGRTKRKSTSSEHYELAKEWLTNFYLNKKRRTNITDIRSILSNYWLDHGQDLIAAPVIKTAINSFSKFLELEEDADRIDGEAQISDINPRLMSRFIKWRSNHTIRLIEDDENNIIIDAFEKKTSPNSVQTYIKYLRAAFNWAHQNGDIDYLPKLQGLKKHQLNGPRKGFITFDMMVDALRYAQGSPQLFNFIIASIGTLARPQTVLAIHVTDMMDFTQDFLDLNPPGREYTSKHRPMVAVPDHLITWFQIEPGHLVQYKGRPMASIKRAWGTMRTKLKWPDHIVSKTIRHSVARTLRNDATFKKQYKLIIDPWELSGHMGHMGGGNLDMTEEYAQYEPNKESTVIQGLNAYFMELDRIADFSLHPKNTRKTKVPNLRLITK